MKKRKMTKRGSKRLFKALARKTHKINLARPSRGGIRM